MSTTVQLPLYRCHKTVRAAKITDIQRDAVTILVLEFPGGNTGAAVSVSYAFDTKHQPEVGGYYVVYEDGYESYSPAAAFEGGYTPEQVDFRARVRAEAADLDERIKKLSAFLPTDVFNGLPVDEQRRLTSQLAAMTDYSNCLSERIAAFSA